MKSTNILLKLAFVGLLASTMACESLFNSSVSLDEENLDDADALAKTATLEYELPSTIATTSNPAHKKAGCRINVKVDRNRLLVFITASC